VLKGEWKLNTRGDWYIVEGQFLTYGPISPHRVPQPEDGLTRSPNSTYRASADFVCDAPGEVVFHYLITVRFTLTEGVYRPAGGDADIPRNPPTPMEYNDGAQATRIFHCVGPDGSTATATPTLTATAADAETATETATPTEEPTATATATASPTASPSASPTASPTTAATQPPTVTRIVVTLDAPKTYYEVQWSEPDNDPVAVEWSMTGEACGSPKVPWQQSGDLVSWSHSAQAPDSCTHLTPDHAVVATVRVFDTDGAVLCTVQGSESQIIEGARLEAACEALP
jgi:hypothetical protein